MFDELFNIRSLLMAAAMRLHREETEKRLLLDDMSNRMFWSPIDGEKDELLWAKDLRFIVTCGKVPPCFCSLFQGVGGSYISSSRATAIEISA